MFFIFTVANFFEEFNKLDKLFKCYTLCSLKWPIIIQHQKNGPSRNT